VVLVAKSICGDGYPSAALADPSFGDLACSAVREHAHCALRKDPRGALRDEAAHCEQRRLTEGAG
jgi:hypothetical protein